MKETARMKGQTLSDFVREAIREALKREGYRLPEDEARARKPEAIVR